MAQGIGRTLNSNRFQSFSVVTLVFKSTYAFLISEHWDSSGSFSIIKISYVMYNPYTVIVKITMRYYYVCEKST